MRLLRWVLLVIILSLSVGGIVMAGREEIVLPYRIPNSEIKISRQVTYEGPIWNGESMELASNVAAIIVENGENRCIAYLQITVCFESSEYVFTENMIPAGSSILIPECSSRRWNDKTITEITVDYIFCDTLSHIAVADVSMDTVMLQNTGEIPCESLRIYYKSCYTEEDLLIGSSFYEDVFDLRPGESREVKLSHYAMGYSKITAIITSGT